MHEASRQIQGAWSELEAYWRDSAKKKYEAGYIDTIHYLLSQVDGYIEEITQVLKETRCNFDDLIGGSS